MNREVLMTVCTWLIAMSIACTSSCMGMAIVSGKNTGVPSIIWWILGVSTALLLVVSMLPSKRKSE